MPRAKKGSTVSQPTENPESHPEAALPVRAKDDESLEKLPAGQGNLTVFNDSDDEGGDGVAVARPPPSKTTKTPPTKSQPEKSEEESDDDEAPEAVSTKVAASVAKKSSQTAQKAAQQQAATQKRKRQERDALFKSQAEERKKVEAEEKAALASSVVQETGDARAPSNRRKRMDRLQLPNVLPAEFLTDSSSEGEDDNDGPARSNTRPKRRKVAAVERQLSRLDRGPKDQRVGTTLYRVAKKTDERLAPKSKKITQNSKDVLRRRNRTPVTTQGGFLRK